MTVRNNKIGLRASKTAATVVFLLMTSTGSLAQNSQAKFTEFAMDFRRECRDAGIVGGSFIFLKDDRIVSEVHYGSANDASNEPVDNNTIYHWASNTKPFTGIAIM